MANLNFQQPPRSIASASLTGRSTGSFGANSLSGHVTPTSGMFPPGSGASSYGQSQPPQLSPNRSAQQQLSSASVGGVPPQMSNSSRSSLFGQRSFADRRAMAGLGGPMSNMGSFMQSSRGYGSQSGSGLNSFHSVFGGAGRDAGTPPLLDLSEFPSLTNSRGQSDGGSQQSSGALQPPGSKPYVGMVKQPTSEQSEFQMSSEDFPALPGTQVVDGGAIGGGPGGILAPGGVDMSGEKSLLREGVQSGQTGAAGMGMELQSESLVGGVTEKAMKRGVQTSPDGKVTNIPASMVNNQFGMVGLLTFIRAAESDPNLVSLAMGQDLTTLGLNLNSPENLYPAFGGPFSDQPCRPQDIDFHVPPEYLVNMSIRDKLAQPVLKKYKDDLLFFLFYTNVGDVMQLAAAAELHSRDWRYHIEEKVWISRLPGMNHYDKNGTTERGTYYYFDAQNWRRVVKDLQIDTGKLDKCPNLNAIVNLSGQPV
ncbi:regulator of gene activity [Phlebotomus argentipes]|uniref:regulator of gene activity n=1 Tax=Phlebotomus argentipes TaxID=94469 RepID=UPI002893673F|nr:regulator of gene activity [Phlebotomus argentipes]